MNGMFPWIKHTPKSSPSQNADDVTTNDQLLNGRAASVKNASLKRIKKFGHFFEIYGRFLTLRPVKMGVLVTTAPAFGGTSCFVKSSTPCGSYQKTPTSHFTSNRMTSKPKQSRGALYLMDTKARIRPIVNQNWICLRRTVSINLTFPKYNSLPLGLMEAFISSH